MNITCGDKPSKKELIKKEKKYNQNPVDFIRNMYRADGINYWRKKYEKRKRIS